MASRIPMVTSESGEYPSLMVPSTAGAARAIFISESKARKRTATPLRMRPDQMVVRLLMSTRQSSHLEFDRVPFEMQIHRGRLIDHVHLVVTDLAASKRFYGAALGALGIPPGGEG